MTWCAKVHFITLNELMNFQSHQNTIKKAQSDYSNGGLVIRHLAENTSKYYRLRTDGEKAADATYTLITEIEGMHERLCRRHSVAITQAGEDEIDAKTLDHIKMEPLESKVEEITKQIRVERDTKARARLGNVMSQLFHAYTSTGDHYHTHGVTDAKRQDSWLPGFQGVSFRLRRYVPEIPW
jgi:hypothetical protein